MSERQSPPERPVAFAPVEWEDVPEGSLARNRFGDLLIKRAGQMIEVVESGPLHAYGWGPFTVIPEPSLPDDPAPTPEVRDV